MISISLTLEQVNGVIQVLNNLPTSSNAWPLVQNIVQQVNTQQQIPNPPKGD